jgi:hypothetical protein
LSNPLWSLGNTNVEFHGGMEMKANGDPALNLAGHAQQGIYRYLATQPNTASSYMTASLVWLKERFIGGLKDKTVSFASSNEFSCVINCGHGTSGNELRFLVRNGSQWYISEASYNFPQDSTTTNKLTDFQDNSAAGKRWGPFNPTATDFDIPDPLPPFAAVDFDNVTGVGLIAYKYRSSYGHHLNVRAFSVDAIEAAGPVGDPPTVSITFPTNGQEFAWHADFTIQTAASDSDGSVTNVEFYQNGFYLGNDTSSPFTYDITDIEAGNHTFAAWAYDNDGNKTESDPVAVSVNSGDPPTCAVTAPADGSEFEWVAGGSVDLAATASDTDGSVVSVTFYVDGSQVNEDTASPYEYTWNYPDTEWPKDYVVRADALDDAGNVTASSNVTFTLTPVGENSILIDFDASVLFGVSVGTLRDRDEMGTTSQRWDFGTGDEYSFWDPPVTQAVVYGGMNFLTCNPVQTNPQLDSSGFYSGHVYNPTNNQGESKVVMLLIWRKDQFLNGLDSATVQFDADSAFRVDFVQDQNEPGNEVRFVVRNGAQYYISEDLQADWQGAAVHTLMDFVDNSAAGTRWAAFNPTTTSFEAPTNTAAYVATEFPDVTQVGLYKVGYRPAYAHGHKFDDFQVEAIAAPPPGMLIILQ